MMIAHVTPARLPSLAGCTWSDSGADAWGARMDEKRPFCTAALVTGFSDLFKINHELVGVMFGIGKDLAPVCQHTALYREPTGIP